MSKWKRILIWVGIVGAFGGVYLWFFGVQTATALMVRYQFRKLPNVAKSKRRPKAVLTKGRVLGSAA